MKLNPYLCFEGRCEEAIEFYKAALGAKVNFLMRGDETPDPHCSSQMGGKIAHASVQVGDLELLMSDGMCTGNAVFSGITLSVAVGSDEECKKVYQALAEGGKADMPPHQTFFASMWGVCHDKFGVSWMVLHPAPVPVG